MCDYNYHRAMDPVLLSANATLEDIMNHRYNDECCQVEFCPDGPPTPKARQVPKSVFANKILNGPKGKNPDISVYVTNPVYPAPVTTPEAPNP